MAFLHDIYGTEADVWEHLWSVPIVATYEADIIFPVELSTISRDDLVDILDGVIESEIAESEAVFVPMDNIVTELPIECIQEYDEKLKNGEILEEYSAVIIYNEALLINEFYELYCAAQEFNPPKTFKRVKEVFLNLVTEMFIHELMHLNVECMANNAIAPDFACDFLVQDVETDTQILNGVQNEDDFTREDIANNEVMVDAMAKIINLHCNGETIEQTLGKVIETRGSSSFYKELDDRLALSWVILFPQDLCEWMFFGAYEDQHVNVFEQKQSEIAGDKTSISKQLIKVGEYFNKMAHTMSKSDFNRTKSMLEMVGISNIK